MKINAALLMEYYFDLIHKFEPMSILNISNVKNLRLGGIRIRQLYIKQKVFSLRGILQ